MTMTTKYSVPPFSGTNYERNAAKAGADACAICGKKVARAAGQGVVVGGGARWGDDESPDDGGHLGVWPVGADCHRKFSVAS